MSTLSLSIVHTRGQNGIQSPYVTVETHLTGGLPGFSIVGLPETAVKESRERVRSAMMNSQFEFPRRRITVNLAPADTPKEGGRFDLPIALGILSAMEQVPLASVREYEFAGELALSGELRAIKGILPFAMETKNAGRKLIVPKGNAAEASLIEGLEIFPAEHLLEVSAHLNGQQRLGLFDHTTLPSSQIHDKDLAEVKGQYQARRALEIAASGGHSLLLMGSPGTGKTMLASRMPSIMPTISTQEALEIAAVQSISLRGFDLKHWQQRPFRSPHHTASSVALVGGGSPPRPGEISLAHNGVLFLDELPEFTRQVLESLREPLESKTITISRAARQVDFPANFQLIAAMNPCPCGYMSDPKKACRCTQEQVQRYRARLSGPFLDRIDMQVEVPPLPKDFFRTLHDETPEDSTTVRERVIAAHNVQLQRNKKVNAALMGKQLDTVCQLGSTEQDFLHDTIEQLNFSARAYHRILKVARTIADLAGKDKIELTHLSEAINYRRLDRD
tara:strand:- start:10012 stop:11526 length:1515 start_codon:yes stop_codon:yes gene_type:complete